MLTPDQLLSFHRDGFLTLRGFLGAQQAGEIREAVEAHFGRPADGDGWRRALLGRSINFRPPGEPAPDPGSRLARLFDCLAPNEKWDGGNELCVRPASEVSGLRGPRAPHLDFPFAAPIVLLVNSMLYVTPVRPAGAAFMYWPGSHHASWRYFRRIPEDYLARGTRGQDAVFRLLTEEIETKPVEFVGEAGDLLVWHPLLLHSASVNHSAITRIAIIGRWGRAVNEPPMYRFDLGIERYWPTPAKETVAAATA